MGRFWRRLWTSWLLVCGLFCVVFFGGACTDKPASPELFYAYGTIESIEVEKGTIVIAHEDIPDLMEAMTMTFTVPHPIMLKDLQPGDKVDFTLMQAQGGLHITEIERYE